MQHTFKIGNRKILAVGVPADANLKLAKHVNGIDNKIMCIKDGKATYIDLPIGYDYKILFTYPSCSEEDAATLVEKASNEFYDGYKDYRNGVSALHSSLESLISLMERENITGKVLFIEKLKKVKVYDRNISKTRNI